MSGMDLSANEAAATHFRGSRYAYDRREVDAFCERVVATLAAYEQALGDAEAKIAALEKAQIPAFRRSGGRPVGIEQSTSAADPLETFDRWRAEQQAASELDAMLASAQEEARMVRAVAVEQAADEIAVLTSQARDEALAVTRRAAQLATETEEAARRRADEIVESVPVAAVGSETAPLGDVDEISRRIVHLRSSIAAVQNRLESLVLEPHQPGSELIEIDLREQPDTPALDPKPKSPSARRRRKRSKPAADSAPSAQEIEERVAQLKQRLGSD